MSNELKRISQRAIAGFAAVALGTGLTITSVLTPAVVHAFPTGGQVQSRALYMSNATPSATSQSYEVTFKPASATAIDAVVLDFCSNSPIIGDSCTAPTGFSLGAPTVAFTTHAAGTNSPVSTTALPGTWAAATSANSGRTLEFKTSSGDSGSLTTSTLYSFDITTVTNPSTLGTYYARIITYTANGGGSDYANYTDVTPGSTTALDYGGYALSTVTNVSVTAKVQESLTFCASAADLSGASNNDCTHATAPTLTLGHGAPAPGILDNTAVDATPAFTQASTNASNGLAIRMHATNSCANAGLSTNGGSTCNITGKDNTAAAGVAAGTTFFGMMVGPSSTTSGVTTSSGTIVPDNNYNATGSTAISGTFASNSYGMDNTVGSGVNSTYGDVIASSATGVGGSGPVSQVNNELLFAATAGLTVPAGIYTGSESLIATGTF